MYQDTNFKNKYPLSPLKPYKKTLSVLFGPILMYIVVFFVSLALRNMNDSQDIMAAKYLFLGLTIVFFLLAIITFFYQRWYYQTYFYNMTDKYIIIRKGPLAPKEITLPFRRIQDINVDQDVLDRLFGLYDVHIATAAGESEAAAHIDGVDKKTAEELRSLILDRVQNS